MDLNIIKTAKDRIPYTQRLHKRKINMVLTNILTVMYGALLP